MGKTLVRCLVVALLTLVAPVQASAECAWVLWEKQEHGGGGGPAWLLLTAFSAEAACVGQADIKFQTNYNLTKALSTPPARVTAFPDRSFTVGSSGGISVYSYICLPDTIDPRGPKGGR